MGPSFGHAATDVYDRTENRMRCVLLSYGPFAASLQGRLTELGFEVHPWQAPRDLGSLSPSQLKDWFEDQARELREDEETCFHPGPGLLAERAEWATFCRERGWGWIGPAGTVIAKVQDKLKLLLLAESAGLKTLRIHDDPFSSAREIQKFIKSQGLGFPWVLKSVKGAGDRGTLCISEAQEVSRLLPAWLEELRLQTGESLVFVERARSEARYLCLPFVRDSSGRLYAPSLLDASLRRGSRSWLEFAVPSSGKDLDTHLAGVAAETRARILNYSERFLSHLNYVGFGQLEFLADEADAFLVDCLPRLSSQHVLWEASLDGKVSAIELQVQSAFEGKVVVPLKSQPKGVTACARVYAENADFDLPSPGRWQALVPARGWVGESEPVGTVSGDGLLGCLSVQGRDISQAAEFLGQAIHALKIEGDFLTNEQALINLTQHPWVRSGIFHADFLSEDYLPIGPAATEALGAVSIALKAELIRSGRADLARLGWWIGGRRVELAQVLETSRSEARCIEVSSDPMFYRCRLGNLAWGARPALVARDKKTGLLRALVSGRVHSVFYRPGARVTAHDPVLWIESLGRIVPHSVSVNWVLSKLLIEPGATVVETQPLAELEFSGNAAAGRD